MKSKTQENEPKENKDTKSYKEGIAKNLAEANEICYYLNESILAIEVLQDPEDKPMSIKEAMTLLMDQKFVDFGSPVNSNWKTIKSRLEDYRKTAMDECNRIQVAYIEHMERIIKKSAESLDSVLQDLNIRIGRTGQYDPQYTRLLEYREKLVKIYEGLK